MSREYRTVKSSKDVGTVSRAAAALAVRELNEGRLRSREGKSDASRFSVARKRDDRVSVADVKKG